ncbi:MAG TPA: hypothetical protein VN257_12010 [Actinotalea sp.]|nr:hypothetical protein [Actinotalea sp.]
MPDGAGGTVHARPGRGARRAGYVASAIVNAVLLYLVAVRPGWQAVPFLTADASEVIPLVEASLVAGIVVNLVWVVGDPPWLRSLGDLVTTLFGVAVLGRLLTVFPFTIEAGSAVETVVRLLLALALVGSVIGVVVHAVTLVRRLLGR